MYTVQDTTQHYELMRELSGICLSADCLNAWVACTHTPYCTTYVSTAVILAYSDQLESRLATLDSSQEALLQVMSVNEINTVKSAQ